MVRSNSTDVSTKNHFDVQPGRSVAHPQYNPIVKIILAVSGLLAITMSADVIEFLYVAGIFIVLCMILRVKLTNILKSIRLIMPWILIFFVIHLIFVQLSHPSIGFSQILYRELIVLLRFIGLAGVMGILRDGMNAHSLVDSIKTLSDRLGISSRLIEDLLQTLRLILLFIPQVIREYRMLERFNLALGFKSPSNLREKISFFGGNLMPVMSRSLARAQQVGAVMGLRGYGQVIPRGQLTPISFKRLDIGLTLGGLFLLTSVLWIF